MRLHTAHMVRQVVFRVHRHHSETQVHTKIGWEEKKLRNEEERKGGVQERVRIRGKGKEREGIMIIEIKKEKEEEEKE